PTWTGCAPLACYPPQACPSSACPPDSAPRACLSASSSPVTTTRTCSCSGGAAPSSSRPGTPPSPPSLPLDLMHQRARQRSRRRPHEPSAALTGVEQDGDVDGRGVLRPVRARYEAVEGGHVAHGHVRDELVVACDRGCIANHGKLRQAFAELLNVLRRSPDPEQRLYGQPKGRGFNYRPELDLVVGQRPLAAAPGSSLGDAAPPPEGLETHSAIRTQRVYQFSVLAVQFLPGLQDAGVGRQTRAKRFSPVRGQDLGPPAPDGPEVAQYGVAGGVAQSDG